MTLVQSRLPRLNGNNLLIILLILSGISSCASSKITSSKQVETVVIQKKNTETVAINTKKKEDSITINPSSFDLDDNLNKNKTTNIKSTTYTNQNLTSDINRIYNIAIILPFNLNQISLGQYADDTTKQLKPDAKNAVEFYLGCQLAKEKFDNSDLKANVYFLDDNNDSTTLSQLFNQKPFPNVDYLLGPLNFKNLKQLATYANKTQTTLISPFANSMYIANNPYYFNATPSLIQQYTYALNQIHTKFPNQSIDVLYDALDSTAESINILKKLVSNNQHQLKVKYTSVQASSNAAKLIATADTLSNKTILIYSSKDTYIKSVVAKLKPSKNKLDIFTSANARFIKALSDNKNPHSVYTVYPFNNDNSNYEAFASKFEEKYNKKPSEIAAQAFDILTHLLNTIDKKQTLQNNIYQYSTDFNNVHTKFRFEPVLDNEKNVDFYDNSFLYLYKYVNGTFVLETPN